MLDAASDAVMETSDQDILAEAKLRHENPAARAAHLRKAISASIANAKRQRLASARAAIDGAREDASGIGSYAIQRMRSITQMQERIAELLKQFPPQDSRLTLAFRNGEEMTQEDTASLLEDLEALARMKSKGS
ncbi:MAG: hypothetical protein SF172_04425 [Burkholderiales bacterium]|nr:hypothetical protein [Betaproteobacteria bacterium]MDX2218247.1 hypothetical protein [Burkholderiales bacterium]